MAADLISLHRHYRRAINDVVDHQEEQRQTMNKDLIINLLTGVLAKGIRYALTAAGGAAIAAGSTKIGGVDLLEFATGAATIITSLGWSWWEDRVRRGQVAKALLSVAQGQTPAHAIEDTTTLNKLKDNLG